MWCLHCRSCSYNLSNSTSDFEQVIFWSNSRTYLSSPDWKIIFWQMIFLWKVRNMWKGQRIFSFIHFYFSMKISIGKESLPNNNCTIYMLICCLGQLGVVLHFRAWVQLPDYSLEITHPIGIANIINILIYMLIL